MDAARLSRSGRVALAAVAVIVALGCGEDSSDSDAQPVPEASVFQEGNFDELPRFRGAEAANDPTVEDDVTTQSFEVSTATPGEVMRFYERELEESGWVAVEPPRQTGAGESHRGVWRMGDQQLIVTSTEFAAGQGPTGTHDTQYSLSLGPA